MGGCCGRCGYNKCLRALEFHHPDQNKELDISRGYSRYYHVLLQEALKCQLVCANCHREIHEELEQS